MVHLITGHAGQAHVKASDEAKINKAIYGNIEAAIEYGNNLKVTIPNSNNVKIDTGIFYMQGRIIDVTAAEMLTIENGSAGLNRNDLVIMQYTRNSGTGVETAELKIKKGTAAVTAVDPALTTGDIDTVLVNEVALYRIPLTGINIGTPVKLFKNLQIRAAVNMEGKPIPETYSKAEIDNKIGTKITARMDGNTLYLTF